MSGILTATPALTALSDEEELFRQSVRDFAATEVLPHVAEMDEAGKFRPDLIEKFYAMGLMGIEVPEQWGGAAGSIFMATLVIEELARVDASAAIYVDVQNTLVNNCLLRWGNEEQKARYFPRLTTTLLGAFALSEPDSGSDAFGLKTRAERRGDHWRLTGRKFWITNGAEAGFFIVFANADFSKAYKGITGFLVIPLYALEKSALAKTMKNPASAPLVIQNFRPVSRQWSPRRSARVLSPKASLPLSGSERAKAPRSVVVRRGK